VSQNTGDFNPDITFLNVDCRWFQGLQSLTPPLPAMPYGFRRTLRFFLIFFGGILSFFPYYSIWILSDERKGKIHYTFRRLLVLYRLIQPQILFFDLSLTLGRTTLSCLILVCVSQQRWLNVLGQKKASFHSFIGHHWRYT
jgi:hypothetical protein